MVRGIYYQKTKDIAGITVQENKFKNIVYFKGSKL